MAATDVVGQSVIHGRVYFEGAVPAPKVFSVASDPACATGGGELRRAENVVMNRNGALKNVFVYVSKGLEDFSFAPPSTPIVLDQKDCRFVPRVLGIQAGQPLRILNSDSTFHNVHALAKRNKAFNLGMTIKSPESRRVFVAPEVVVPLRCNVHPWMGAYLGVVEHPFYAVTDSAGFFSLPHLRAGHYTIEAWHEEFGRLSQEVFVGEGEIKTLMFAFPTD